MKDKNQNVSVIKTVKTSVTKIKLIEAYIDKIGSLTEEEAQELLDNLDIQESKGGAK